MRTTLTRAALVAAFLTPLGCTHDGERHELTAPFDGARIVGRTSAVWSVTDDQRAFAGATRLDEPEIRVRYRLDVENDLQDKVFLRLKEFTLVDEDGLALGGDSTTAGCTLAAGKTEAVVSGNVWLGREATTRIADFRISHHVVPLGERGSALYREWQRQGRPDDTAEIDAEIARYAAAPPCTEQ